MPVRRVVTGEVDGRSRVVIDDEAPRTWCDEIWSTSADEPLGTDPGTTPRPVEVPAGGTGWRMVSLPPDAEMRARLAERSTEGVDGDGFHRTQTIDYVVVLDGPLELVLDDGSVVLEPGDCVVQRETNHAWRNHNDHPVRLLALMVSTA